MTESELTRLVECVPNVSEGRRPEVVAAQDPAHRRCRHPNAQLAALPHDPYIAPARVLPSHPHDQIDDIGR